MRTPSELARLQGFLPFDQLRAGSADEMTFVSPRIGRGLYEYSSQMNTDQLVSLCAILCWLVCGHTKQPLTVTIISNGNP